ncbi:MAG: hypothetical protein IJQ73_01360 [Kiritimatiellae bacterium]|nr:hypothetical protein [Kiritimatiellia bacterium]
MERIRTQFSRTLLCVTAAFALGPAMVQAAPRHQAVITVSGYNSLVALENFPVPVRVSESNISGFRYSDCAADGADVAFEDGAGNALDREIECWDPDGESLVWVRVPTLANGLKFKMTWGDSSVSVQPASQTDGSVWTPAGYAGVWHMNEDSATQTDRTGNGLTATTDSGVTYELVDGQVGKSLKKSGALRIADFFSNGAVPVPSGAYSVSCWYYWPETANSGNTCPLKKGTWEKSGGWYIEHPANAGFGTMLVVRDGSGISTRFTVPNCKDGWSYLVLTYDGASLNIHANGSLAYSWSGSFGQGTHDFIIGDAPGYFDETRVMRSVASKDWIAADYAAQTGTLLSYGAASAYADAQAPNTRFTSVLTVSGYTGASALASFPALVRVSEAGIDGFHYADCADGGSDVVFLDADGNVLPREIDTWNTNGESLVWVRLTAMATNTVFTMAWGDAHATAQPDSQTDGSVWTPNGYVGVWHMNEAGGAVADATAHGLAATPAGNTANSIAVSGAPTGAGRQTATSAEKGYLSIPSYDSFGVGSTFTMSGWMKMTGLENYPRPFSRKNYYTDDNGWEIEMANSYTAFSARGRNNDKVCSGSFPQSHQDNWAHISVVYNGSTLSVYQNGSFVKSATIDNATDNALPLSIGCNSNGSEAYIRGAFDECRLLDAVAPADWLKAEYETIHVPGFLTYGEAVKASSGSILRILGDPAEIGSPTPAYGALDGLSAGDQVSLSMPVTVVAGDGTITNYLAGWRLEAVDLGTNARSPIASSADPGATFNACAYTHDGYAEFTWLWDARDALGVDSPVVVSNGCNGLALSIRVSGIGYTEPSATLKLAYGVSPDAMSLTNVVSSSVTSIGEVAGALTRLTPGTAYYVKAVIDNGNASAESPAVCLVTDTVAETTDRIIPGLYHVSFTSGSTIGTDSYAGATTNVVLSPDMALTTDAAAWGDNTTHVYWGRMYLDGSTYNFAESIDDAVWLKIDGSMVLNDSKWDGTTVGSITRPAGWYDFELRMYNGSGGAGPADKDGWGTETFGFGCNTSGYTGKAASNYTIPVDDGSGSLFLAPGFLPGMTASENVSGGALASVELSFPALGDAATLRMAYGPSHGGEDPAGWAHTASVAPLAAGAASYSWTPPANWGVDDFIVVRFYYMDGDDPVWSNSIFWRDYSLPSLANVAIDGTGGDAIAISGSLSSFGGADCAITAYVGASPDAMTNAWPCGVRDATGDFSYALFEADASSALRIVPGSNYYVSLEASSGGQVSRSPVQAVTTKAAPVFKESSVSKVGRTITVTAALADCGARDSAQVRLYFGTSEDESAFAPAGNAVTVTDGEAFTIQHSLPEFNVTYWWQLRAVATTTGGEALEARTAAASIEMTDDAEYTWKSSVASGNWDDPANWTANKSGDIIGYPSSSPANAVFAANTEATVTIRASHRMSRLYVKAGASVSFVNGAADGVRPTLTPWLCEFEYDGGMVSLDNVAIVISENVAMGSGRTLRMRNNAYFEFRSFPNYNLKTTIFDIKDSTMRRTGVDSFRVRTGPAGAVTGVFDGGRIESKNDDAFSVGVGDGTYAHVIMTNGQFVGYGHVFAGESGATTGILEFLDGCELVTTKELVVIQAGGGSSSTGTLRVCDSAVYNTHGRQDVEWMVAGNSGVGTLEFSGAYVSNTWGYATIAKNAGSTGSLVLSNGTTVVLNKIVGGAGTSTLVADGAVAIPKLMKNKTVVEDFISGVGTASLGADGLTIRTDYATTVSQGFTNLGGARGLLVMDGPGAKTLTGASTHSVTRLAGGDTKIAVDHVATVEVAGGVLNLADGAANAVTYGGLVVGTAGGTAGILAMDAGDTITTTAAPVFNGVHLALNGEPADGTYTLVRTTASPTAASEAAWRAGYIYSGRQDGKMYVFTVTESGGTTSFNLVVADGALGSGVVWTAGGASGAYATGSNWDGGSVPGVTDIATFSREDAAPEVVVSGDQMVGAIAFSAEQGYTVSGGGSLAISDTGNGYISASGGSHEIATDVVLASETGFAVDAGAALEVSGDIQNGAVRKTGGGTLALSGEGNSFMDKMTVEEGTLSLASAEAGGFRADSASNDLVLEGGTFRFDGSAQGEALGRRLVVDAGSSKAAVADIESPLVVTSLYMKTGSFIKRGPEKLTFDFSKNTTVSREKGNLQHMQSGSVFDFPTTGGMSDTGYFAGFSVAEGAVELKGLPSVTLDGGSTYLDIGLNTSSGTADPELILNGVRYGDNASFQIGASSQNGFARNFTYRLINGARHGGNSIYVCGFDNGPDDSSNFLIDIEDGSYLAVSYSFWAPELQYGHLQINVRNGSALAVPGLLLGSPFDILVENGSFGKNQGSLSDAEPGTGSVGITLKYNSKGEFTSSNAVFRVHYINRQTLPNYNTVYSTNGVAFNFDNAVWHSGSSDVALRIREAETVSFNVMEGGLVISNDLGHTFLTTKAFTGPGALTKAGAGDLVFDPAVTVKGNQVPSQSWDETTVALDRTYTLDVTGGLNVLGGAVYVTAATMRPGLDVHVASGAVLDLGGGTIEVASLSGAGTIRNGTIRTRLLKVDVDAGAITLDDATIDPARVVIDFGRAAANPLVAKTAEYDVCRFTASAPDYSKWKAANTGLEGVAGRFFIDGDTVKVVFQYIGGTMIILK